MGPIFQLPRLTFVLGSTKTNATSTRTVYFAILLE